MAPLYQPNARKDSEVNTNEDKQLSAISLSLRDSVNDDLTLRAYADLLSELQGEGSMELGTFLQQLILRTLDCRPTDYSTQFNDTDLPSGSRALIIYREAQDACRRVNEYARTWSGGGVPMVTSVQWCGVRPIFYSFSDRNYVPAIQNLVDTILNEDILGVRRLASYALGTLAPLSVPEDREFIVFHACGVVGPRFREQTLSVINTLSEALIGEGDTFVRRNCIESIGMFSHLVRDFPWSRILEVLNYDPEGVVRRSAAETLGRLGELNLDAISALENAELNDPDRYVRKACATVLSGMSWSR